jgi:hypothetical protein
MDAGGQAFEIVPALALQTSAQSKVGAKNLASGYAAQEPKFMAWEVLILR